MIRVTAGVLDRRVRIERPVAAVGPRAAGKGTWEKVGDAAASIVDQLPSRSEQPGGGMPVATRRARVRMRYRSDITPAMRLVAGDRIMQIVSGPVELGRRGGLEMLVEDYSAAGNAA